MKCKLWCESTLMDLMQSRNLTSESSSYSIARKTEQVVLRATSVISI